MSDLKEFVIEFQGDLSGGTQTVYRFDNGYGASLIVGGMFAYGGREIAVLAFDGDEWSICYSTPLTDDVIGHLSPEEARSTLLSIQNLPARDAEVSS